MLLSHDDLVTHYKTAYMLMHHHKWSLTEMDNLMPWERTIYVDMLTQQVKIENERIRDEMAARRKR